GEALDLGPRLGVGDAGGHELHEPAEPDLGSRRNGFLAEGAHDHGSPGPTLDDDRRRHDAPEALLANRLRDRAAGLRVIVDPSGLSGAKAVRQRVVPTEW